MSYKFQGINSELQILSSEFWVPNSEYQILSSKIGFPNLSFHFWVPNAEFQIQSSYSFTHTSNVSRALNCTCLLQKISPSTGCKPWSDSLGCPLEIFGPRPASRTRCSSMGSLLYPSALYLLFFLLSRDKAFTIVFNLKLIKPCSDPSGCPQGTSNLFQQVGLDTLWREAHRDDLVMK